MTRDSVDPPSSFARRYRLPIAFGVSVVAVIVGLRLWLNHQAEQRHAHVLVSVFAELRHVGIVETNVSSLLFEQANDIERGALTHVVDVLLVSHAQH